MVDICAGICFTTKTCVLLGQRRKFFECGLNSQRMTAAKLDLLSMFALQMLNFNSVTTGNEEMRGAAQTFTIKVVVVSTRRKATAYLVPPALHATQKYAGPNSAFGYHAGGRL